MKIGIFGDSFANKYGTDIWWKYLDTDLGHNVRCFGESGSSLGFSVDLINYWHQEFDHIIWCATSVNRISFWHKDIAYHNTGTHRPRLIGDRELDQKTTIIHDYLTQAYDSRFQEILGQALIHFMLAKYRNLTIIPSFNTPVYHMQDPGFNLYDLCVMETEFFFPTHDSFEIINSTLDRRHGHLTKSNQKILSTLINNHLQHGIFATSYENFVFDKNLITEFGG